MLFKIYTRLLQVASLQVQSRELLANLFGYGNILIRSFLKECLYLNVAVYLPIPITCSNMHSHANEFSSLMVYFPLILLVNKFVEIYENRNASFMGNICEFCSFIVFLCAFGINQ